MGQIATKGWIYSNKSQISGWSGDSQCPTKSVITGTRTLSVSGSYDSNQLVQQSDISLKSWTVNWTIQSRSPNTTGLYLNYSIYIFDKYTTSGAELGNGKSVSGSQNSTTQPTTAISIVSLRASNVEPSSHLTQLKYYVLFNGTSIASGPLSSSTQVSIAASKINTGTNTLLIYFTLY